jgi:hypothetical protein
VRYHGDIDLGYELPKLTGEARTLAGVGATVLALGEESEGCCDLLGLVAEFGFSE